MPRIVEIEPAIKVDIPNRGPAEAFAWIIDRENGTPVHVLLELADGRHLTINKATWIAIRELS